MSVTALLVQLFCSDFLQVDLALWLFSLLLSLSLSVSTPPLPSPALIHSHVSRVDRFSLEQVEPWANRTMRMIHPREAINFSLSQRLLFASRPPTVKAQTSHRLTILIQLHLFFSYHLFLFVPWNFVIIVVIIVILFPVHFTLHILYLSPFHNL